jgi:hypothetical protein
MNLNDIDKEIYDCNLCSDMIEKFPNSKTVSIGKNNDIVILGEAPANNGWRKSGIAWYDINHKLLPSGVVMQKLLDILDIKLEDTCFLESVKCYPKDRKYLNKCSNNWVIFKPYTKDFYDYSQQSYQSVLPEMFLSRRRSDSYRYTGHGCTQ